MPNDTNNEQQTRDIQDRLGNLETRMNTHYHGGFDSSVVNWASLYQRRIHVSHTIYGADAATAANYSVVFIAPYACLLTLLQEAHKTAGTDGSAVTLDLEKLTGTTAPGSGVTMLGATIDLKGTINTVKTATLASGANLPNLSLAAGDRAALKLTGTPTAVANVTTLLEFQLV